MWNVWIEFKWSLADHNRLWWLPDWMQSCLIWLDIRIIPVGLISRAWSPGFKYWFTKFQSRRGSCGGSRRGSCLFAVSIIGLVAGSGLSRVTWSYIFGLDADAPRRGVSLKMVFDWLFPAVFSDGWPIGSDSSFLDASMLDLIEMMLINSAVRSARLHGSGRLIYLLAVWYLRLISVAIRSVS